MTAGLGRDLGLLARQVRYEQRIFWRNRGRGLVTFVLPILFLVIFASLDRGERITSRGNIPYDDFFIPGILAYGVISTTFQSLAASTAILRDNGILKRMQGTPLPHWAYIAARIASATIVTGAMTLITLGLGVAVWSLHFSAAVLPGALLVLLLGTAALTTLGIGMARFLPNADSAQGILAVVVIPLTFISNVWFPYALPSVLSTIASIFPLRPLATGLQYAFDPRHHGVPIDAASLRTLAIWTVIGVYLMVRFLRRPAGEAA
jgi:ABC-2 type transport system permease protein